MGGYHQHGKGKQLQQTLAPQQKRQAGKRTAVDTRQLGQGFNQHRRRQSRRNPDQQETQPPAVRLTRHPPQRNAQHHRQHRSHTQQAQSLISLALGRNPHRQSRRNRPKQRVRQGDHSAADQQNSEIAGEKRQHMAACKHRQQNQQQHLALRRPRHQHQRQRHQGHHPRIHRNHHTGLGGQHAETAPDIAQQRNRDKFGGIEDKGRAGKREHTQPARRFCRHRFTVRSQKGRLKIQTARDCTPFGKQIPPDGFQTASEADIKELKNAFCLQRFQLQMPPAAFPAKRRLRRQHIRNDGWAVYLAAIAANPPHRRFRFKCHFNLHPSQTDKTAAPNRGRNEAASPAKFPAAKRKGCCMHPATDYGWPNCRKSRRRG